MTKKYLQSTQYAAYTLSTKNKAHFRKKKLRKDQIYIFVKGLSGIRKWRSCKPSVWPCISKILDKNNVVLSIFIPWVIHYMLLVLYLISMVSSDFLLFIFYADFTLPSNKHQLAGDILVLFFMYTTVIQRVVKSLTTI